VEISTVPGDKSVYVACKFSCNVLSAIGSDRYDYEIGVFAVYGRMSSCKFLPTHEADCICLYLFSAPTRAPDSLQRCTFSAEPHPHVTICMREGLPP